MVKLSQFFLSLPVLLAFCISVQSAGLIPNQDIEVVAKLDIRPGNVTATTDGRVFATIHPMGGELGVQLVEIKDGKAIAWPSQDMQAKSGHYTEDRLDSPLGITKDKQGGLWIVDFGLRVGKTRIWGFDIASGDLIGKIDIPIEVAPVGSLAQDLVLDRANGWAYLAATGTKSIIAVNLKTNEARIFSDHASLQPDEDARLIFDGKELHFFGKPAREGINPITLSADGEIIFYGPMTGIGWFSVPAKLFRDGADDETIAAAIKRVGNKPMSDGVATDATGNHYFTNLMESGIDVLGEDGKLTPLIRDARFSWPDNVQTGEPNTLYIAVNQLHKSVPATGDSDQGKAPYFIFKATLP